MQKSSKKNFRRQEGGFTLVELMITLLVCALVIAAVAGVFIAHSRHYSQQDDLAELQQNLSAILAIMPAEFRLAGCDPLRTKDVRIKKADATTFEFTADLGGTGASGNEADGKTESVNEHITYSFDRGASQLLRDTGDGPKPLADNIEQLEFNYILDDGEPKTNPTYTELNRIRAVQISLLARASHPAKGQLTPTAYTSASGQSWPPDTAHYPGYRYRYLTTTVQLRNMAYN